MKPFDFSGRIGFRHLKCIVEIHRTGSAALAARRLNITPSAVSKTIKEFEETSGIKVFRGSRRGSEATIEGKLVIDRMLIALTALESVYSDLPGYGPSDAIHLRIGALPIVSSVFLPEVLNEFCKIRPRVQAEVISGSKVTLLERLRQGSIDIMFGRLPAPADLSGLQFEQIFVDTYIFVVRKGHPLSLAADLRDVALGGYRLLMPTEETVTWNEISRFFHSHGLELPHDRTETIYLNLSLRLTETADYIWVASEQFAKEMIADGRLVRLPINTDMLNAPIGLITRGDDMRTSAISELARIVRRRALIYPGSVTHEERH